MQATMKSLVNNIIAPYFNSKKEQLGLLETQCALWKIDYWLVHKSEEFCIWMKKAHPTIIMCFVPGGCTGLWQPLNVGIQCVLKQSMKQSVHKDIITEATTQLKSRMPVTELKLDTTLPTLQNLSVQWLVNAYHDINNQDLIPKVHILTYFASMYLTCYYQ
jgi:hypothetical protein